MVTDAHGHAGAHTRCMNRKKKKDKHSEKTISKLERAVEEDEQVDKRTPAQKKFQETQRKRVCAL